MGYVDAHKALGTYREQRISSLLGEKASSWFTSAWSSLGEMLKTVDSAAENSEISASYASSPSLSRVAADLRLDYVCGLRREIRKQYVSGEEGVCTDVTPFRHGALSAHGAKLFDDVMEAVLAAGEKEGGATA